MDELLLILNPTKTGRTAITVQTYTLELTWDQLPVIRSALSCCSSLAVSLGATSCPK